MLSSHKNTSPDMARQTSFKVEITSIFLKGSKRKTKPKSLFARNVLFIFFLFITVRLWAEFETYFGDVTSFAVRSISEIEYFLVMVAFNSPFFLLFVFDNKTSPDRDHKDAYDWLPANVSFKRLVLITFFFPCVFVIAMMPVVFWSGFFDFFGLRDLTDQINYVWFKQAYAELRRDTSPEDAYATMPIYLASLVFLGIYALMLTSFMWRQWKFYKNHVLKYEYPAKKSFPITTAFLGAIYFLPAMLWLVAFYPWLISINISNNLFLITDIAIIMWALEGFISIYLYLYLRRVKS